MRVAVACRIRSGGALQFLVVNPVMPHTSGHSPLPLEMHSRCLADWKQLYQDIISRRRFTPKESSNYANTRNLTERAAARSRHSRESGRRCKRGEKKRGAG